MNNQEITLKAYDEQADRYDQLTEQNPIGELTDWVDLFLAKLKFSDTILEIGSGHGRDAKYMVSKGFKVIITDASKGMVELLRSKSLSAKLYDPLKGKYPGQYNALLAGAVLLHFSAEQLDVALSNLSAGLPVGGYFCFWVKQGVGEEITDQKLGAPRYFKYWQEKDLTPVLEKHNFVTIKSGVAHNGKWLHYIVRKKQA